MQKKLCLSFEQTKNDVDKVIAVLSLRSKFCPTSRLKLRELVASSCLSAKYHVSRDGSRNKIHKVFHLKRGCELKK